MHEYRNMYMMAFTETWLDDSVAYDTLRIGVLEHLSGWIETKVQQGKNAEEVCVFISRKVGVIQQ